MRSAAAGSRPGLSLSPGLKRSLRTVGGALSAAQLKMDLSHAALHMESCIYTIACFKGISMS